MNIIPLEQGSEAWLEWRASRWMASEAAIIMGCQPSWAEVTTWEDLRLQKAGLFERSEKLERMGAHGHAGEASQLATLNADMDCVFEPACVEATVSHLAASLDGLYVDGEGAVSWAEIKTPTARAKWHVGIKRFEDIPAHYQWQLIHQFAALGVEEAFCHFRAGPDVATGHPFSIKEFGERIDRLTSEWLRFSLGESRVKKVGGNEWAWWAAEYRSSKEEADAADSRAKEARNMLISLGHGQPAEGHGVKLAKSTRAGAIDTKAMATDGIDVEKYRKPGVESWTIRLA